MTTQSGVTLLINGFGVLFVILNSFGLGLRLPIGKLLGQVAAHWKIAVWALAINFVVIPVVFVGYLLTIASSIPGEIKVGFCVAALCAGMPFAPLLAKLAKADASIFPSRPMSKMPARSENKPARAVKISGIERRIVEPRILMRVS